MTNQEIWERYPYLRPWLHEEDGFLCFDELPIGWNKLFLQMCEDIRQPLIDTNYINEFQFVQLKEKFSEARFYYGGVPEEIYETINRIICDYEHLSYFVCQHCGAPATVETRGWIGHFCNDCASSFKEKLTSIEFEPTYIVRRHKNGEKHEEQYDVTPLWNRLYGKEQ